METVEERALAIADSFMNKPLKQGKHKDGLQALIIEGLKEQDTLTRVDCANEMNKAICEVFGIK